MFIMIYWIWNFKWFASYFCQTKL